MKPRRKVVRAWAVYHKYIGDIADLLFKTRAEAIASRDRLPKSVYRVIQVEIRPISKKGVRGKCGS